MSEAPTHAWAKELVCGWVEETDDVALLQAWFDACRAKLARLNAPRRGLPLKVGCDVFADGKLYVITAVEHGYSVSMVDVTTLDGPKRFAPGQALETVKLELLRSEP